MLSTHFLPLVFLAVFCFSCPSAFVLKQPVGQRSLPNVFQKVKADFSLQAEAESTGTCPFSTTLGRIGTAGIISNIVCDYSLFVLKTTGAGLPAGPFGLEGALEGISYLIVTGVFGWSLVTKIKTGSGLDAGPLGLLGAAEGLSFLT